MSSDQLWDCKDISKKEVFVAEIYKKKLKIFSASLDIFVEERKRERRKRLISSQRMWQCLLGSSSFRTFSWFWDNFWEYGSIQSMFQKKVVTWCSHYLPPAAHNDHRFVITVVIIVVTSLSDIWKERMGCCDDDDADADDDDKHQAYQIFQNLKREAWF